MKYISVVPTTFITIYIFEIIDHQLLANSFHIAISVLLLKSYFEEGKMKLKSKEENGIF